ncbi:MAG: hypothetical protein FWG38_07695 [Defluviitaleaceae bacterium]|nr:hypothetical protein [Defluviitaleaceae bacterium]
MNKKSGSKGTGTGKKKFKMPSAYVIVFLALLVVVGLTYFIPVSVRDYDTGQVVYNAMFDAEGNIVEGVGAQPAGIWDILMAPVLGFQSAAAVGIALLIAGGFLNVMNTTGGLEAGIGVMLKRLKGNVLIALMVLVCALMGTVFGFWEEIVAFSLVVVPMFVFAGYDVMMGLAVLFLGATVGNMASVVNPFSTGAAVAAIGNPDMTMGSGIVLRMVIFAALYAMTTFMLMRYGAMVKKSPEKGALAKVEGVSAGADAGTKEMPEMTRKRMASALLFVGMIVVLIIGYVPWADIGGETLGNIVNAPFTALAGVPVLGSILGAGHMTPFGDWGFDEFSVLFFVGAIILMLINRIKVEVFVKDFLAGAKDLLGVVIVLSIARGIAIVMGSSSYGMSVTLVYWISNALANVPLWTFAPFTILAFMGIGLALQSTSGVAGISMPILGAVVAALFAGEAMGTVGGGVILVSAFTIGLNFTGLLYPSATNLGTIELFNVPYNEYLKFMVKYSLPLILIATVLLSLAAWVGFVF